MLPENPDGGNWHYLNGTQRAALNDARGRLIAALDSVGRSRMPDVAAKAQAKFDCWVEEEDEGWQEAEIAACRGDFNALLALMVQPPAPMPPPMAAPVAQHEYIIYFDWDSARITPEGMRIVDQVASDGRSNSSSRIGWSAMPICRARRATTCVCRCVVPTRCGLPWRNVASPPSGPR
ncbi:MAG: hypothetical protein WDO24_31540 [Pseudomonadota bacterium]